METMLMDYNLFWQFKYIVQELVDIRNRNQELLPTALRQELSTVLDVFRKCSPTEQEVRIAFLRLMQAALLAYSVRQRSDFVENIVWLLAYIEQVAASVEAADRKITLFVPLESYQTYDPSSVSK
jgi:hypothetical protein